VDVLLWEDGSTGLQEDGFVLVLEDEVPTQLVQVTQRCPLDTYVATVQAVTDQVNALVSGLSVISVQVSTGPCVLDTSRVPQMFHSVTVVYTT
jgi:hypothetical protein